MYYDYKSCEISDMQGKTFDTVGSFCDQIIFTDDEYTYILSHDQDCCESVYIESIVGDLEDLTGEPIRVAEESTNDDPDAEYGRWTFYKFATRKGWVDIRWYGSSNGYYGVSVSCKRKTNKN